MTFYSSSYVLKISKRGNSYTMNVLKVLSHRFLGENKQYVLSNDHVRFGTPSYKSGERYRRCIQTQLKVVPNTTER